MRRFEISIATSNAGMLRLMRALILTGSSCGPAFRLDGGLGRGISAFFVVAIPDNSVEKFQELCRPEFFDEATVAVAV